jgi:Cd2+/Zn2+-exporting ATPase
MERTQRAIESLLTLRPSEASVKRAGGTVKVAVEDLEIGEIVIVRPGEQIPVDGIISEGSTNVDESSLTGESMPVSKSLGSTLFAGTLNQSGGVELKVTPPSREWSSLSPRRRPRNLALNASSKKPSNTMPWASSSSPSGYFFCPI